MPIGSPTVKPLPVPGTTTGPLWASQLNDAIQELKDDVGSPVGTSGIGVDADLPINGFQLTAAAALAFVNKTASFTSISRLYQLNGDLWFNDINGAQIRITLGGTLNFSATGGITGDYPSGPASASFSNSTNTYTFLGDASSGKRGKIDCADILLREAVAGANAITLKSPTSLASAYSITAPAALPSASSVLLMSSTGVLSLTRALSVDTVTTTSNISSGNNVTATGNVSGVRGIFSGDVNGVHGIFTSTVKGTDHLYTTAQTVKIGPVMGAITAASALWIFDSSDPGMYTGGASSDAFQVGVPLPVRAGDRVTAVTLELKHSSATAGLVVCTLQSVNMTTGSVTAQSDAMASAASAGRQSIVFTGLVPSAVAANQQWYVLIDKSNATSNILHVYGLEVGVDRPA